MIKKIEIVAREKLSIANKEYKMVQMYSELRNSHLKIHGEYECNNPIHRVYNAPTTFFKMIPYPSKIDHDPLWKILNLNDLVVKQSISDSLIPKNHKKHTSYNYELIYAEEKLIDNGGIVRKGFFLNKNERSIALLSSSNCKIHNVKKPVEAREEGWFVHKGVSAPLNFWYEVTKYCKENF